MTPRYLSPQTVLDELDVLPRRDRGGRVCPGRLDLVDEHLRRKSWRLLPGGDEP